MKIVFFISSLSSGGAERVVSTLANGLSEDHEVVIATANNMNEDFYPLDRRIRRVNLLDNNHQPPNKIQVFVRVIKIILCMMRLLKKERPDVAVSFINKINVMSIVACNLSGTSIICSERSNPNKDKAGGFFGYLRQKLYPYADMNIFQTDGARSCFVDIPTRKTMVIQNPLVGVPDQNLRVNRKKTILAMGRFVSEKRFDRMIEAVEMIQERLRKDGWHVELYGGGKIQGELNQQILDAALSDLIQIRDRTKKPLEVMSQSSIFILSSDYEGFPNVLSEAMACGCVPVSVDCDFGPSEIIENRKNGLLVEQSVGGIAGGLLWLLDNPDQLEQCRDETIKIREHLHVNKIVAQWEIAIQKVVSKCVE